MSPSINWDEIDRAVGIMEQNGLVDVRAQGHGPHTATIDFNHPEVAPWMNQRNIASSAEVNTEEQVIGYTLRFPGILRGPDFPDRDRISQAVTVAADDFPPGRRNDVVLRTSALGSDEYAPHLRGSDTEYIPLLRFVRLAAQAQDAYYDALL